MLFTSDRNGNTEVYRMLPDGREQTADLHRPVRDGCGRLAGWPVDCLHRHERRGPRAVAHEPERRNAHRLTSGGLDDYNPAWSPGGEYLAFVSTRSGQPHIYRLGPGDGCGHAAVCSFGGVRRGRTGHGPPAGLRSSTAATGGNTVLYTMAADGSGRRTAFSNPNSDAQPSWSPAGDRLVF